MAANNQPKPGVKIALVHARSGNEALSRDTAALVVTPSVLRERLQMRDTKPSSQVEAAELPLRFDGLVGGHILGDWGDVDHVVERKISVHVLMIKRWTKYITHLNVD